MVRKRPGDNIYEREKRKSPTFIPSTPLSNSLERNTLNDSLLSLYKQETMKLKVAAASLKNGVEILEDSNAFTENKTNGCVKDIGKLYRESKKMKKSNKELTFKYSSINFDDIGGIDGILEEIDEMFERFTLPEHYQKIKASYVRGILLHGPPGCGKTYLAHAIAGELEIPIIEVSAPELIQGIPGQSESKIRDTFDEAVKIGRCILFIDEIDVIGSKRENSNGGMENRIVSQMLKCLDGLKEKDPSFNVTIIGATNFPDSIDPALRREGRFDVELLIGVPNEKSRLKILQILLKEYKLSNFDLEWIVHHTPGFVASDLKILINKALQIGMRRMRLEAYQLRNSTKSEDITSEINYLSKDTPMLQRIRWRRSLKISEKELEKSLFKLEDFEIALQHCVPSAKREGHALVPAVTWEDIGALDHVKEEIRANILWPVKNRELYEKNKPSSGTGIILYGPKGCGKTLVAKAIANECNINFLCVNGPELLNMYLGESEKAVRRCFERARHLSPCVLFFDEFDGLCPPRSSSHSNSAAERVTNQLLTEFGGIQDSKDVFVIAATNRIENIDTAMLRFGRLGTSIYVGPPTREGRVEILKSLTKNKTHPKIAEDLSLETIAYDDRCEEFSGADLAYLVDQAAKKALAEIMKSRETTDPDVETVLNMSHFNKAFEVVHPSLNERDRRDFLKNQLQQPFAHFAS